MQILYESVRHTYSWTAKFKHYLERKCEEVCSDLFKITGRNSVVATVVRVLDVALVNICIIAHNLQNTFVLNTRFE